MCYPAPLWYIEILSVEYEFSQTENQTLEVNFSSGSEAVGRWISDELGSDIQKTDDLLSIILELEKRQRPDYQSRGREFQLSIIDCEVQISAHSLDLEYDDEDIPESTNLYNSELESGCGLEDFKAVLLDWRKFVKTV